MENQAFFWLFCNLLSIVVLGFFSMQEMASVSFNKVRLQYYVSTGMKRAVWLNYLLQHPSRLFGTTLICVNFALVFGSECARQFHSSLGISPDLAPISQVVLVVIFGELAPMFAARHYPEHVAMLGVPIVYATAKLMTPFLWIVGWISYVCNYFVGGHETDPNIYLTQEELQKILEEKEEDESFRSETEDFNAITANIFLLRGKDARQVMEPIGNIPCLPSNSIVEQVSILLKKVQVDYIPIYHQEVANIIGIALPRDLVRIPNTKRVRDYARSPWFVTENTNVIELLKQFRHNHESVAVILDKKGRAIGIINLDDILEEIFGKQNSKQLKQQVIIDKTFPGDMKVEDFNRQFGVTLSKEKELTLTELMEQELGHPPEKGDSIYFPPFELTVKESPLIGVKTILITTRI